MPVRQDSLRIRAPPPPHISMSTWTTLFQLSREDPWRGAQCYGTSSTKYTRCSTPARRRKSTENNPYPLRKRASRWGMVYPKDSAWVGPGYNYTPASPPTYMAGQSGGRPSGHSAVGTHYFPEKVAQYPGADTKHHPGHQWIKGHIHTGATCPQTSGGAARPTHNGRG